MKKRMAMLLAVALVLNLAACRSSKKETTASTTEAVTEITQAPTTEAPTEPSTEAPTEAPTEPSTEAVTEETTEPTVETVPEPAVQYEMLWLGTSLYSIDIPVGYGERELTEEAYERNQVASYQSEAFPVRLDVYQFDNGEKEESVFESGEMEEINGITVISMKGQQEIEGTTCDYVSYAMKDGDHLVQLVFWLNDGEAQAFVESVMSTLKIAAADVIQIGNSSYGVTIPANYTQRELTAEERANGKVAFYTCNTASMAVELCEFTKAEDQTVESLVKEQLEQFKGTDAKVEEINGISALYFEAAQDGENARSRRIVYTMDDKDNLVQIIFYVDSVLSVRQAAFMVQTLTKNGT